MEEEEIKGFKVPLITKHARNQILARGISYDDIAETLLWGDLYEAEEVGVEWAETEDEKIRWKLIGPEVTLILNYDRTIIITVFQSAWRETKYDRRKRFSKTY